MNKKIKIKIILLLLVLTCAVLLGIIKGSVNIPFTKLLLGENLPILQLRFSRILISIIAGSGLAVSGIALQAILRNPLAEPYLLGTSSGAGLGAILVLIIGASRIYLPLAAFISALASIILVYNLARQNNKLPEQSLILSGVIVSVALSAIIIFLISISTNEALHGMMWWLWGNLQVYDSKLLFIVSVLVLLGIAIIYIFSQDLNALSIGDEEATHLGVNIELVKKIIIFTTSLITASLVCICGIIGFVGLIVPHSVRLIFGPDHRLLIPSSALVGASFLIASDTLARSLLAPIELPVGVITAAFGGPFFIYLLKTRKIIKTL